MKDARDKQWDGALPIEPLSDISWQRVERSVFAELDAAPAPTQTAQRPVAGARWHQPSWRWAIPTTALAAAAVLLIVLLGKQGGSQVALHDGDGGPLPTGPSRIATGESSTEVVFGDATITVAPHSAVHFGGDAASGAQVLLERGAVSCAVAPRRGRPPFAVLAGTVRVEVVGTLFSVERRDDTALVVVEKGQVQVIAAGQRVPVSAGERWPAEPAAVEGPDRGEASDRAGEPSDSDSDSDSAGEASETGDDGKSSGHRTGRGKADKTGKTGKDDSSATEKEPHPDARQRYEEAAELEASSPASALDIYRELAAAGSGPWAANALFAAGRLEAEREHPAAARRLLASYLRRFPRGLNADDARALLDRLQPDAGTQPKELR